MTGVLALAEDLIGNRLSRSVADINPHPAPAVPRPHMPELIAVIVIVRIIIVAVRSAEADKPPEVVTMIEEMAMVEERTMVQTGDMRSSWPDMHSSWPKGTNSRWTRSTESRWTRSTDSRWTRSTDSRWRPSAEMRAAHGGTTALKTTAATVKAATAEATTAVAAATGEPATAEAAAVAAATAAATTASLCKSIGRGEGDANCRHSGKKKSDLSAHGTSPGFGIA